MPTERPLFAPTPGIPEGGMSWEQLKDIVAEGRLDRLGRTPSELERYAAWSGDIKREYGSTVSYVQRVRLRWEVTEGEEPGEAVQLLHNDFPYAIHEGIEHYVLWSKEKALGVKEIEEELNARMDPSKEYIYAVNPPHLQTIREIFHAHVFAQKRK